jgi:hypothetical protein
MKLTHYPHGVEVPGEELFFSSVHLHGGPAPVRRSGEVWT